MIFEKTNNYFYKTINKINGKFYYGIRSTDLDPNNDVKYIGSGHALKQAIKKYGFENFDKIIICNFNSRKEASEYERQIVTEDLVYDPTCYNMKLGGLNGFVPNISDETRKKMSNSHKGLPKSDQFMKNVGFTHPAIEINRRRPKTNVEKKQRSDKLKGIKRSIETKIKMSKAFTGRIYSEEQNRQKSIRAKKYYSTHINSRKGKFHSNEAKLLMSQNNKNKKKCLVDGVIFDSIQATANYYNLSVNSTKDRIKSSRKKWENWNLYNPEG